MNGQKILNSAITLTREEAQQVLDALINAKGYIFYNVLDDKGNRYDAAADILRARLSAPEPEQLGEIVPADEEQLERIAKLVEPEPEPVAWKEAAIRLGEELSSVGPDGYYNMTPQQWLDWALDQQPRGKDSLPAPPQCEWQGLTDEEIRNEANHHVFDESFFSGAVWARGKIKEKNNE